MHLSEAFDSFVIISGFFVLLMAPVVVWMALFAPELLLASLQPADEQGRGGKAGN